MFVHLHSCNDHIGRTLLSPKSTFSLGVSLFKVTCEPVLQDSGMYHACHAEQRYSPVVVTYLTISVTLIEMNNGRNFEVLRNAQMVPNLTEEHGHFLRQSV